METREQIETRLAELHQQRGAALLNGKTFDNAKIVAEHEKLQALEDVEAEAARRSRTAAAEAADKEQASRLARIEAMVSEDIQDIIAAEAGARQTAAAFSRIVNRNLALTKLSAEARLSVPAALSRFELGRRLGALVSAVMSSVSKDHRRQLGQVVWQAGVFNHEHSWRDVTARIYETLMKREITDAKS
jgi:hypothetical protein